MNFVTAEGCRVTCSPEHCLGSGGRGEVFDVGNGLAGKVLKARYRTPSRRAKVALLREKLKTTPGARPLPTASPVSDLFDEDGNWVGYTMPKIEGERLDIYLRETEPVFPDRLKIALALANVLCRLHRRGIVVGDLDLSNIQWSEKRGVVLFDVDSFQVYDHDSDEFYNVEEAHLQSPIMMKLGLKSGFALPFESDDYLLAYCLHQVIFLRDPLYEFKVDVPARVVRMQNARDKRYAYAYHPDSCTNAAGPTIEKMFYQAFEGDVAPNAYAWQRALKGVVKEIMAESTRMDASSGEGASLAAPITAAAAAALAGESAESDAGAGCFRTPGKGGRVSAEGVSRCLVHALRNYVLLTATFIVFASFLLLAIRNNGLFADYDLGRYVSLSCFMTGAAFLAVASEKHVPDFPAIFAAFALVGLTFIPYPDVFSLAVSTFLADTGNALFVSVGVVAEGAVVLMDVVSSFVIQGIEEIFFAVLV